MTDFRDLGKCGNNGSHSHYSKKLTGNSARKFLKEISTLSVDELTQKYGDLSKIEGYIGGAE